MSNAVTLYYRTHAFIGWAIDAVVQTSDIKIGFSVSSSQSDTVSAYSPADYQLRYSSIHESYVELAWSSGGIAFDINYYAFSSLSERNSAIFNTIMFSFDTVNGRYCIVLFTVPTIL